MPSWSKWWTQKCAHESLNAMSMPPATEVVPRPISETTTCDAPLDLGEGPGTDCEVPPGSSFGNTHASRSSFYHLNRAMEKGRAWLPVLHVEKEGWYFTALFSNTARAHELGKTRDWVVIYYERDGEEDQCTVVTERSGALRGRRVVRGREDECARLGAREGS